MQMFSSGSLFRYYSHFVIEMMGDGKGLSQGHTAGVQLAESEI